MVVVLGYGFIDSHINKMLGQALRANTDQRLLVIARCSSKEKCDEKALAISKALDADVKQIIVDQGTVKSFLEQEKLAEKLFSTIPKSDGSEF